VTDFREKAHGYKFVFDLKWQLDCATGTGGCLGSITLHDPVKKLPHGLDLLYFRNGAPHHWGGGLTVQCPDNLNAGCLPKFTGEVKLELVGLSDVRADEKITIPAGLFCQNAQDETTRENFTLKFDRHGNLDRKESHLGRLG
jgi:hypothetical protein